MRTEKTTNPIESNWDHYKRKQINITKGIRNNQVNRLLEQHYTSLQGKLINGEEDQDLFNDTFIKLTYNYDPEMDFKEQFTYYFNLLKGNYYSDLKVDNYRVSYIEDLEGFDAACEEIDEQPKKKINPNFKNELIAELNAISKESKASKTKRSKQSRKTKDLSIQ